jgi:hypothetical protein
LRAVTRAVLIVDPRLVFPFKIWSDSRMFDKFKVKFGNPLPVTGLSPVNVSSTPTPRTIFAKANARSET